MNQVRSFLLAAASVALVSAPLAAQDGPAGPQSGFNFGGTGIDNSYVLTNANAASIGVTLALTASPRCGAVDCPAALGHSGSTFFANPGASNNSPGSPDANWNFDFGIAGTSVANYTYTLTYDFNPAVGNTDFGTEVFGNSATQNSYNLGFVFLGTGVPGFVTAPSFLPFDPTANGEYTFRLSAIDGNQHVAGFSDINVDVGTVPTATTPEPATLSLLGTGMVGLVGFAKRKRRK